MAQQQDEPSQKATAGRLNALRAAVLGANDGIVSVAGIVVGVAGATTNRFAILTAGISGLAAGALSMAAGEYVSVGSQRDTARAHYTEHDAQGAPHPDAAYNPWHAAIASAVSFLAGALIPLVTVFISPHGDQVWITFVSVIAALALTGYVSAAAGGANKARATLRVVIGGALAMGATYGIGKLVGGTHIK